MRYLNLIDNKGVHNNRRPEMLSSEAIKRIHDLYQQGMGFKPIARATGISRNTVRKYVRLMISGKDIPTKVKRPSKLDPYRDRIHDLFLRCKGYCPILLRMIKKELGISIGLRQLQKYCNHWRRTELRPIEMTQRYEVLPGNEMQIDFGEYDITIDGNPTRVHFFVAVMSYSRRCYVKLFPAENQTAWFSGIESAFKHFGCIAERVLSDNSKCLVDRVDACTGPEFNVNYKHIANYWRFKPQACRPFRAKTKGKVERTVGYVKTSCLAGMEAESLEDAQKQVEEWMSEVADVREIKDLEGRPIDRFIEEQYALRHRPYAGPGINDARTITRKVDVSGCIRVDNVNYQLQGVPAGTSVDVVVEKDCLAVFLHNKLIQKLNPTADKRKVITFLPKSQSDSFGHGVVFDSSISQSLAVYEEVCNACT